MLLIQNGTISSVFNLLRLSEVFSNTLSPFVAFYKRYFTNVGNYWHRKEGDTFEYGYFYAQLMTFYSIALLFSSTVPFICIAALYLFSMRHITDFVSILSVHGNEIDSSGNLINSILKYNIFPVMLYHLSMTSYFFIKEKYTACIATLVVMILSIIYYICIFNTKYIVDIYSLHEKLKVYEYQDQDVVHTELNKWRNKFKHPLVVPIPIDNIHPSKIV
jgi:hypothetical protein